MADRLGNGVLFAHAQPGCHNGTMTRIFVAIGSNVGNRQAYMDLARRQLASLPATRLVRFSDVIETEPVGPVGQQAVVQGRFLNAAAELDTQLSPAQLLEHLQAIERLAGRPAPDKRIHWGPRTLDLDLLLYGEQVIDQPGLTVPHPRMHQRQFVLEPQARIGSDVVHPTLGQTIGQLLAQLAP